MNWRIWLVGGVVAAAVVAFGPSNPPATTGAAPLAQATNTPTATPTNTPTPTATPRAAPNFQRIDQPDGGIRCYWYEEDIASMSCVVAP